MQLIIAERKQALIKLGIQGPSGSGKSYSALLLAHGLVMDWNKIAVIDSENHSAHLYSHLGGYNVLNLSKPFNPERYIEAIETCEREGMQVIIIDSISQEWSGESGILDLHGNMAGNSFTNWAKITPRHNAFVQRMLQSPCHLISTIRSKQDYVLTEKNGKMVPEKVGMQGVTREDLSFEFTIVFDLDIKHNASASKDRTGLFMDNPSFIINETTGKKIKTWCMGNELLKNVELQIADSKTVQDLRNILIKYPTLRDKVEPLCLQRKKELDSVVTGQIVEPLKNE
jgi:hypothetical protein